MLIHRDGSMASPFRSTPNFANLISAAAGLSASPSVGGASAGTGNSGGGGVGVGYLTNPPHLHHQHPQYEAIQRQQKEYVERVGVEDDDRADARGKTATVGHTGQAAQQQYVAQNWLTV